MEALGLIKLPWTLPLTKEYLQRGVIRRYSKFAFEEPDYFKIIQHTLEIRPL